MIMYCDWCGKEVNTDNMPDTTKYRTLKRGYCYCSRRCSINGTAKKRVYTEEQRKISSETMKKTNERYHDQFVERMKKNNPMKRQDVREAVSNKLKEIGHKPKVQGGNGRGMTIPQRALLEEIEKKNFNVAAEYPVLTKGASKKDYPTCYKIDIALVDYMIAIEVDGNSHYSITRQAQDRKKEEFLNGLGWKVLRFKNKQVMEHLEDCVRMVMSTISK